MAATTPYTTPVVATMLAKGLFKGYAPSNESSATTTELAQIITWTDSMIDMAFQAVGYKVPFQDISGETWPTHQTALLQLMSSVGAMAFTTGYILSPAPSIPRSRADGVGERNAYAVLFETFRKGVAEHGYHFRAQYYLGTKAEKWITEPYGPRTDFQGEYYDPTRFELLRAYTDRIDEVFGDIQDMDIDWDYLYSLSLAGSS